MNTSTRPLKFVHRVLYHIVLFGLFFQFFAFPAYAIVEHYPYGADSKNHIPFIRPDERITYSDLYESDRSADKENTSKRKTTTEQHSADSPATSDEMILEMHSAESLGVIGYNNESRSDDPADNLFSFEVDKEELQGRTLRLSYEVYGIENTSGIARSINEHTATGGFFVQKTDTWKEVKETVSIHQLKQGLNHILFTTFENQKLDYKIRNVKLSAFPVATNRLVSLADGNNLYVKEGKAYIKGTVLSNNAQLYINGKHIPVRNNEFETVLENASEIQNLDIRLMQSGSVIYYEDISIEALREVSDVVAYKSAAIMIPVRQDKDGSYGFALADVDLNITKENYENAERITVQKLRDIDVAPVGTNIINVTAGTSAYRFLPDGATFNEPAKLTLRYDEKLLPKGYDGRDVKVLYFDMQQRRWLAVPTDTIIADQHKIVALTDHFTDYIAGVIQAPESPETNAFTPTSISDIQVANPTANIMQMQPPTANQKGDGTLEFPITVPAGRGGMQPNLSVTYNNNGSSGMAGYGWDIELPHISVDTRFGVPEYNTGKETESYLLNGEELVMQLPGGGIYLPHRSGTVNRNSSGIRLFFPKTESSFSRIERHGNNPKNYTWEIYDKSGTKYYYNVPLSGSDSNAGKWYLSRTEDINGNYIQYLIYPVAVEGGTEMRLNSIEYNMHEDSFDQSGQLLATYFVRFDYRDQVRPDTHFNYRYGFKEVNASWLDYINVRAMKRGSDVGNGQQELLSDFEIQYKFNYNNGKFGKTLLNSIVTTHKKNIDANTSESESYTHSFDYYDDLGGGSLFGQEQIISVADDFTDEKHSVLSSTIENVKSSQVNVGAGISPIQNVPAWWPFSFGGTINFAFPSSVSTESSPTMLLLDIDGDGLDDKVMQVGSEIKYRKNLGGLAFSDQLYKAHNIYDLGLSESKTKTDPEMSLSIIAVNLNSSKSETQSRSRMFFSDVNSDGLVDYVKDKIVYFNRMDPNSGLPTFTDNSALTPNLIIKEQDVAPDIAAPLPDFSVGNDLMDVVKVWVAPRNGTIDISGNISKNFVASHNGVRYSVEHSAGVAQPASWNPSYPIKTIDSKIPLAPWDPDDVVVVGPALPVANYTNSYLISPRLLVDASHATNASTTVTKGDHIYFRVNSSQIPEELVDVTWNPTVSYTDGFPYSSTYNYSFLHGDAVAHPLTISQPGHYRIEWPAGGNIGLIDQLKITVQAYRYEVDAITQQVSKVPVVSNDTIVSTTIIHPFSNLSSYISPNINGMSVDFADPESYIYVEIEVSGASGIDWKSFDNVFIPVLKKTDSPQTTTYIVPKYDMRANVITAYHPVFYPAPGPPLAINNSFYLSNCAGDPDCDGEYIYFTAWYEGEGIAETTSGLPAKLRYRLHSNGTISEVRQFDGNSFDTSPVISDPFTNVIVEPGKNLNIEYTTDSYFVASVLNHHQNNFDDLVGGTIGFAGSPTGGMAPAGAPPAGLVRANIVTKNAEELGLGTLYRDWGQFAYKGAAPDENFTPINKNFVSRAAISGVSNFTKPSDDEILKGNNLMNIDPDDVEFDWDDDTFKTAGTPIPINQGQLDAIKHFTLLVPDRSMNAWKSHERLYVKAWDMSPYLRYNNEDDKRMLPILAPTNLSVYGAVSIVKEHVSESKSSGKSLTFYGFNLGDSESRAVSRPLNDFMDINGDGYPDIIGGDKIQFTSRRGGLTDNTFVKSLLFETQSNGSGKSMGGSTAHITSLADPSGRFTKISIGNSGTFAGVGLGAQKNSFITTTTPENVLVDINGDGLADIIKPGEEVEFNKGYDFVESTWSGYTTPQLSTTDSRSLSADFGVDISNFQTFLPSWMTFEGLGVSNLNLSYGANGSRSVTHHKNSFVDFNGDGLPDYIQNGNVYFNTGTKHIASNTSLDRLSESSTYAHGTTVNASILIPISIFVLGIIIKVGAGGGKSNSKNYSEDNVSFRDFDGDGYVDLVESASETEVKVRLSRIGRTNMLKTVHNPTGSKITMDYATHNKLSGSGFGSTYKMPFKKWVLSSVEVDDGFAGDGEDVQKYAFEYQNGLKDRRERKFLGFGEVKTHQLNKNDEIYRTVVQEYMLNNMEPSEIYLPGNTSESRQYQYIGNLPTVSSTYDGMQRLLSKTTNEYFIYSIDGNTNYGPYQTIGTQPSITYTDVSRIVPLVARTINNVYHYQGNSTSSFADHQTIAEFRQYDKYGNLTHYYDQVDANTVEITYHDLNTSSQYVVNVPATHKVNIYERYSTTEIDTVGNITAINRHKDGITTGGDVATTNLEYDALGNLTKVILPKPQMSSGQSERMFYEYTYDDLFKLFVTEVNDAYGYTSSTSYNHFGMPLTQKDLNNVEFEYTYDAVRRVKQLKGPYNTTWTIRNEYKRDTTSGLYYAITQHNIADEITNPSTQQVLYTSSFADGLGRILQTKKQLDTEHDCGGTGYRLAVSGLQMYDEFGRVTESYLGQEELDCGGTLLTALETYTPLTHQVQEKTSISYDMQDRVLQSHVHGLNATTKYEYGFGPDPTSALPASMEKVTLPEGNISATYKDRKGRVVSTQQTGNGSTLVTTYRYYPLGQLKKVTDAEGEETQYEYDTFGQKVKTIHPSSKISNFTYDLTGKLIASDNPNLEAQSKQIVYNYWFNQLQSIVYPGFVQNGVSYFPHTVTYSYGAPAAPDYGAGRITAITDLTGNKTMKYGALGEVVEETRLLESQSSGNLSFTTQYRYDSWGRMMELTYPDGEEVVYGYNSVGQLISIISNSGGQEYLTDVQYNFFDQPVRIEYGNEVVTTNEYDITQRIRAMQLDRPDTSTFMRNVYSYDRNQNITGISNTYSQHPVLQLGGVSDKTYTYDQFNRLKTASGNWQGGLNETHNYTLNMAYNKTHGIVNKNQYHNVQSPAFSGQSEHSYDAAYKYQDATHPHAVSQIVYGSIGGTQNATASFTYDLNGNMTLYQTDFGGFDDREMIWDEQNRLLAVVDDQTNVSHYVYDHAGERTFKAVGTTSTINIGGAQIYSVTNFDDYVLYPSGYVVVDPGKNEYSKHYYINGKRFVSRLEQGASQFVAAAPPPSPYSTYGNDSTENNGLDINALMGSQYTTFGINIGNNEQDCEDQMTDIIASYTAANNPPSHSVQHCIDYFQGLVDDANDPNKDYDFCDALKDANKYICDPIDLNNPGNDPEDTSDPDYTQEEKEKFDCLTELNILVAQYAAAVAQQTAQSMMLMLGFNDFGCNNSTAAHCCMELRNTGEEHCEDCPELTREDCGLVRPGDQNPEWLDCIRECLEKGDYPDYGIQCFEHFENTGEWWDDCYMLLIECDCNEFLDIVPAPDPEVITCLRSCEIEGIDEALEYYDTTGYWKAEYDHFIDDCECGEDDPGPGITPIDRDMRDCALNCSDTNAFGCWEHFHITGEWLPGCKETMRDCGCYDPDDQHDCYRKALNYIKNELILEPYNNSCEVLEYVRTHFKCIPLPLDPEDPEIEDELPDDWDDGGGNDSDPGATDGPYDEYQRKPIWWYHSDHLGSSTYLTDNFGRPSHYYETLPFGEMIVEHNQSTYYKLPYPTTNTGTYDNKFKYNGKELDAATGMYYYGARYYDPRISIFVSTDPLMTDYPNYTPYHYVHQNPINLIDPTGMSAELYDDPPEKGTFVNGDVHTDDTGSWTQYNGAWYDNSGQENNFLMEMTISVDRKTDIDISNATTAGQMVGGTASGFLKDASKPRMQKSFYHMGSSHYLNSIDFNAQSGRNVGVHFYSKGYQESMKQMSTLYKSAGAMNTGLTTLGYVDAGIQFYQGNYVEGGMSAFNNTASSVLTVTRGWGYGLLYTVGYSGAEYILTRSETYNSLLFGKGSAKYNSRRHHWQKSKLLDE